MILDSSKMNKFNRFGEENGTDLRSDRLGPTHFLGEIQGCGGARKEVLSFGDGDGYFAVFISLSRQDDGHGDRAQKAAQEKYDFCPRGKSRAERASYAAGTFGRQAQGVALPHGGGKVNRFCI